MTTSPYDDTSISTVLRIYGDHPLQDGDAVLLFLDGRVCLEMEQLAVEWDEERRRKTAELLRRTGERVLVAIARRDRALLPSDYHLWRDLHAELRGSDVDLLPVRALPAA